MNEPSTDNMNHHGAILKELSDIKSSLAVNTNETANIKTGVVEIKNDVKDLNTKVGFQNGRVTKQEEWSKEAQKVIENTTKIATETYTNYKTDKTRIWAVIGVLIFLGGTIITLSIMAIDSKISKGINQGIKEALSVYEIPSK